MSAPESEVVVPAGLVKIDAPDALQGWKLVEVGSDEHKAAEAEAPAPKSKAK
jgi:hypothetical protein